MNPMFTALLLTAVAIGFWLMWAPIAWRAIRTGRLLGRGAIYDRDTTPKMYWGGLICMGSLGLLLSGLAIWAFAMALL